VSNHLSAPHAAKGTQCREEINGFEHVRFSLRVVADQDVKSGAEFHVEPRVIAEIAKA
jgi:hypothetical protein